MAEAAQQPAPPDGVAASSTDANADSLNTAAANLSLSPPSLSPRSASDGATEKPTMAVSSMPLGNLNAARKPPLAPTFSSRGGINASQDIQARMKAFRAGRQAMPPGGRTPGTPGVGTNLPQSPAVLSPGGPLVGGIPAGFKLPPGLGKPVMKSNASAPAVPGARLSLAEKRGLALSGGLSGQSPVTGAPLGKKKPGLKLADMNGGANNSAPGGATGGSLMDKYSNYIDKETGTLRFAGKAVLNSQGVEFASGTSFNISLDEVDTLDELGKGNYGTVYKVRHSRPRIRRPGMGLAGNKASNAPGVPAQPSSPTRKETWDESSPVSGSGMTGVVMAMKEIRLELDDAKFAAIIMELDILHRCVSPQIVNFYGAFFQEGAVYICMEFMDGGSIDKIYGDGIPEPVLRKIALSTTLGLKSLKDDHNIIHRDVKPTNILINTRGQVKICDFGVSGNLVASIAKTNIGCQSYMAPERISSGGIAQAGANPGGGTYSVQSDIWSLGLSIIECAMGRYPYPPETYDNIFSQLSVSALLVLNTRIINRSLTN